MLYIWARNLVSIFYYLLGASSIIYAQGQLTFTSSKHKPKRVIHFPCPYPIESRAIMKGILPAWYLKAKRRNIKHI